MTRRSNLYFSFRRSSGVYENGCRRSSRVRCSRATVAPLANQFKAHWLRRKTSTDRRRSLRSALSPEVDVFRTTPVRRRDVVSAAVASGPGWQSVCVLALPPVGDGTTAWDRCTYAPQDRWTVSARSTPSPDFSFRSPSSHLTFSTGLDSTTTSNPYLTALPQQDRRAPVTYDVSQKRVINSKNSDVSS